MSYLFLQAGSEFLTVTVDESAGAQELLIFPTRVESARQKAAAGTAQATTFKASLDAGLGSVTDSGYQYGGVTAAIDYALGYQLYRDINPSLADDYAGKAVAVALSCARDSHRTSFNSRQYVARGTGSQTQFTLPHTPVAGTISVWLYTVVTKQVTRGSGGFDATGIQTGSGTPAAYILKVSDTDDGSADYARGTDWRQGGYQAGKREDSLTWVAGGNAPSVSSAYWITHTTSASSQSSSLWSVTGDTLTFNTAPSVGQAVVVRYVYHDAVSGLRYQQTGNGLGGPGVAQIDLYYPVRYGYSMAVTLDWLWDWADFSQEIKDELAQAVVDWYDLLPLAASAWPGQADQPEGNYGVGWIMMRTFGAVAIQGRHAEDSRLASECAQAYRDTIFGKLLPPEPGHTSLYGGCGVGGLSAYGNETYRHNFLCHPVVADNPGAVFPDPEEQGQLSSALSDFANDTVKFLLHARYSEAGTSFNSVLRPGLVFEAGDNIPYPVPAPNKGVWTQAAAFCTDPTLAAHARHLVAGEAGDVPDDWVDLLFRDPSATATDWIPGGGALGLAHYDEGHGIVLARSDWDDATDPTWVAFQAGNISAGGGERCAGYLDLARGPDRLLVFGTRRAGSEAYAGIRGTGNSANMVVCNVPGLFPWNNTYIYGQINSRPHVTLAEPDLQDDYVFVTCDHRATFASSSSVNDVTELTRDWFFIRPDKVVVYDRVTTSQASYQKSVRWHLDSTTHPVGSGTWELVVDGDTMSPAAWNASAATVDLEVEALSTVGLGGATVTKYCDGHWRVTFVNAPTTITGTYSAGTLEIFPFSSTAYEIVLSETLTTTPESQDVNSSRVFVAVDSTEALTRTRGTVGVLVVPTTQAATRLAYRPTADVASVRFVSSILSTTTADAAMDHQHLVSSPDQQVEGARVEDVVCLFRRGSSVTFPDTVTATYNGTLTWYVSGLTPSTTYDLTGASTATFGTNAYGVGTFTSTGVAGTHQVILGQAEEPPEGAPVYSMAFTNVTSLNDDLAAVYAAESVAQGGTNFWTWSLQAHAMFDNGGTYPGLVMATHHNPIQAVCVWKSDLATPGGTPTFTRQNGNGGELGNEATVQALGHASSMCVVYDYDGDGKLDLFNMAANNNRKPWRRQSDGTLSLDTGALAINTGSMRSLRDLDSDGDLDWEGGSSDPRGATVTLDDNVRQFFHWNGTSYVRSTSNGFDAELSGVPQAVIDEINGWIQTNSPSAEYQLNFVPLDLDNDGTLDLVIAIHAAYGGAPHAVWFLQNDGAGNYTDKGADWGLPSTGWFVALNQFAHSFGPTMWPYYPNDFLHKSITAPNGTGVPTIFISQGSAPGQYYWNGSGYTKHPTSALNARLVGNDPYPQCLLPLNLTNSLHLDVIYRFPRFGSLYVFVNDGTGNFQQYTTGGHTNGRYYGWDPHGWCVADFDNDGKLDLMLGGEQGPGVSTVGVRKVGLYRNTTTDPGRWLKVLIRRAAGQNRFGVGAVVECYTAGQSFAEAAKLSRWYGWANGLPTHHGLGNKTTVDLKLTWSDGTTYTQTGVSTNQTVTVTS